MQKKSFLILPFLMAGVLVFLWSCTKNGDGGDQGSVKKIHEIGDYLKSATVTPIPPEVEEGNLLPLLNLKSMATFPVADKALTYTITLVPQDAYVFSRGGTSSQTIKVTSTTPSLAWYLEPKDKTSHEKHVFFFITIYYQEAHMGSHLASLKINPSEGITPYPPTLMDGASFTVDDADEVGVRLTRSNTKVTLIPTPKNGWALLGNISPVDLSDGTLHLTHFNLHKEGSDDVMIYVKLKKLPL